MSISEVRTVIEARLFLEKLDAIASGIDTSSTMLNTLASKYDTLLSKIETLDVIASSMGTSNTILNTLADKNDAMLSKLAGLDVIASSIDASNTILNTLASKYDTLLSNLAGMDSKLTDIIGRVDASNTVLNTLANKNDTLLSTLAGVDSKLADIIGGMDTSNATLNALASKNDTLLLTLEGVDSKLADIIGRVDASNTVLNTLVNKNDALLSKLDSIDSKLADIISNLASMLRYGRVPSLLQWFYGSKVTAPPASTPLFSYTVSSGRKAYIYGFFIYASEGNTIEIRWSHTPPGATTTLYTYPVYIGGAGTLHTELSTALNEGTPADPLSTIEIVNINDGSTESVYMAGLLIGEI